MNGERRSVRKRSDRSDRALRRESSVGDRPRELSPPAGLDATLLDLGGEEHVLLSYALPELHVPFELTASEREVVLGVLRGEPVAAIALSRGRSVNTVRNQLRSVYMKLGVGSRVELVRRCSEARSTKSPPLA